MMHRSHLTNYLHRILHGPDTLNSDHVELDFIASAENAWVGFLMIFSLVAMLKSQIRQFKMFMSLFGIGGALCLHILFYNSQLTEKKDERVLQIQLCFGDILLSVITGLLCYNFLTMAIACVCFNLVRGVFIIATAFIDLLIVIVINTTLNEKRFFSAWSMNLQNPFEKSNWYLLIAYLSTGLIGFGYGVQYACTQKAAIREKKQLKHKNVLVFNWALLMAEATQYILYFVLKFVQFYDDTTANATNITGPCVFLITLPIYFMIEKCYLDKHSKDIIQSGYDGAEDRLEVLIGKYKGQEADIIEDRYELARICEELTPKSRRTFIHLMQIGLQDKQMLESKLSGIIFLKCNIGEDIIDNQAETVDTNCQPTQGRDSVVVINGDVITPKSNYKLNDQSKFLFLEHQDSQKVLVRNSVLGISSDKQIVSTKTLDNDESVHIDTGGVDESGYVNKN